MNDRNNDDRKIDALLNHPETRTVEFKAARETFSRDEAINYCVAIANEGGGELVLGVTDKLPRQICGSNAIPDLNAFELLVTQKTKLNVVAREIKTESGRVVIFQIPRRRRGEPVEHDGKYLVRRGESLVPMGLDALREILDEAKIAEESLPAMSDLRDDEVGQLLDTDAFFRLIGETPPGQQDRLARLEHRRLLTRTGHRWSITNAGALFLARDLGDFADLALRRVRLIRYDARDRLNATLDQFEARGYGLSFDALTAAVTAQYATREVIDGGRRELRPDYAPRAVREFVGNALVHQDLEERSTQLVIEVFDDRLEIRNPGRPTIDIRRFVDETKARNPDLAEVMRLARFTEIRGSGVDRALEAIESLVQRAPEFVLHDAATSVILRGQLDVSQMTDDEKVRTVYLHCCLRYEQRQSLTNTSLRQRVNLPPSKTWLASNMISATVEAGLIKPDPRAGTSRKYAAYLPFFAG